MTDPAGLKWYGTLREANLARQAEWDGGKKIGNLWRANEMAGEIGEALEAALSCILLAVATGRVSNVIKKLEREALGIKGSRATHEDLGREIGDGRICLDLVAMEFGIDVDRVTALKFNETSEKVGLKTRLILP